jgi:hypothetical protein
MFGVRSAPPSNVAKTPPSAFITGYPRSNPPCVSQKLVFNSGLARVDRAADVEAFIRSHVYKPAHKKLVTSQQLLVGVADGPKTTS